MEVANQYRENSFDSLLSALGVMERTGLGYGMPSIFNAHQLAVFHHTRNNNLGGALKTALKIRFLIEPAQKPRIQLHDRLSNLFNIIVLLQAPDQAEEIRAVAIRASSFFRSMYVRDIAKCYGHDSMVYEHEHASLRKTAGFIVGAIPDKLCVENVNKLLTWAGLGPRPAEELTE
jgi:hypothetical protein